MRPILTTVRRAAAALTVAAAAATCIGPATASAAEVTLFGPTPSTTLMYYADSGENNKLKVTRLSPGMVRLDDVYGIDITDHAAGQCTHPFLLDGTVVDCVFIHDRYLLLDDGNDTVTPAGGTGSDIVSGGAGSDRAEYSDRTDPVTVLVDNNANDGELGEHDDIGGDVEVVTGGAGDDILVDVLSKPSGFLGGSGNDLINGGGGWDATLVGGDGNDTIYGADGNDMLWGDAGDDVLNGGAEADRIEGGPDQDKIHSDDDVKESVLCGTGIDRVKADPFDDRFGCERMG